MLKDMRVVDADSHPREAPDFFTKRAPAAVRDRVPRVEGVDGQPMRVIDGHPVGRFSAGAVIARDGTKESSCRALMECSHDEVHLGAHHPVIRLRVLEECGIDAQLISPSTTTCLCHNPLQSVEAKMQTLSAEVRHKIRGENVRTRYRL